MLRQTSAKFHVTICANNFLLRISLFLICLYFVLHEQDFLTDWLFDLFTITHQISCWLSITWTAQIWKSPWDGTANYLEWERRCPKQSYIQGKYTFSSVFVAKKIAFCTIGNASNLNDFVAGWKISTVY